MCENDPNNYGSWSDNRSALGAITATGPDGRVVSVAGDGGLVDLVNHFTAPHIHIIFDLDEEQNALVCRGCGQKRPLGQSPAPSAVPVTERPDLDAIEKRHEQIAASSHLKLGYGDAALKSAADIPALLAYARTLEARIEKVLALLDDPDWTRVSLAQARRILRGEDA